MKTEPFDLAYPIEDRSHGDMPDGNYLHTGLTKREYFAAMAMQGILALPNKGDHNVTSEDEAIDLIVKWSVKLADGLIKALNETK